MNHPPTPGGTVTVTLTGIVREYEGGQLYLDTAGGLVAVTNIRPDAITVVEPGVREGDTIIHERRVLTWARRPDAGCGWRDDDGWFTGDQPDMRHVEIRRAARP